MNYFKSILIINLLILSCLNYGQADNSKPFNLDFTREAAILGTGVAAGITAFFILDNINPLAPDEINSLNPSDVNGFDRGAIGTFTKDHLGDALLYGSYLLPLTFLAYEGTNRDFLELALMYGEVLLIQGSINGIVKGTVLRTRPYVYNQNTPLSEKTENRARISFFSGHTSITSAVTFFTARVFTEYIENNTTKIIIWSAAALIPAVTAVSRVNTHWHFPTDVIVGYAFGALVGYFIPELHKNRVNENIYIQPSFNFDKPMLSVLIKF
jgi:membrane-associated phospholipid phosphatase